jgi:hypothetical protein
VAIPDAPDDLRDAGRKLWDSIAKHEPPYELRPDEVRILVDACAEADLIADLELEQANAPIMVKGSMGQKVISPMISELRQHRTVLAGLLKSLKLPDTPASAGQTRDRTSELARAAARARWGAPKGA